MNVDPLLALAIFAGLAAATALLFWPRRGLLARWRRAARMSGRVYREDALKYIHKTEAKGHRPTLEGIAGAVGVSLDEAARLLAEMATDGLAHDDGGTPRLTPKGHEAAVHIIRAHRLWERYLAEETGYDEAEWHEQAELREHRLTPEELEALAVRLGNPSHDPHGDPIPTAGGMTSPNGGQALVNLPIGQPGRIVHLEDEPETVYAQLVAEGLSPGQVVRVTAVSPERIHFFTNEEEHVLAPLLAANIHVRPLPIEDAALINRGQPLSDLRPGERGRVIALSAALRGQERRRLFDLGLLPGTEVTAEVRSPSGDPTAYRVRGAMIALRAEQAKLIRIESL